MRPRIPTSFGAWSVANRCWSRSLATNASEAAAQLMSKFRDQTIIRKQTLDGNQLQRLCLTLGRPAVEPGLDTRKEAPPDGTPIPPGYHLVYFTPADLESMLGPDGTDQTYNAPAPFSRRMWAGGQMTWENNVQLRIGDVVEEHTTLRGATAKQSRSAGEMVLVDVRKEFRTERGLSLVDERSWVFRPPPAKAHALAAYQDQRHNADLVSQRRCATPTEKVSSHFGSASFPERHLRWSPVALFRFSALTFNAHMIHYNETWTRTVEGHPDVVVHGPLNLINMLDYWRDYHSNGDQHPRSISYRALSPIFVGETYAITTDSAGSDKHATELSVNKSGVVCMKGTITSLA
ncbi:hypothetical protein CONLIGDRAFT_574105 [Coniochaeta ligniaria NRRL 30616]|uniref:FAS1-like dehydratase domain-containing protein n=1 Tax=Coniochaeta ligniaria NRRL 30616 TaxID=1408157 RepID=A0A1J7IT80_9PEZI|nr:hypothetical protein CONLIGDRAFT_574105 [Coniochaeta ligniaria NRRL 30616]